MIRSTSSSAAQDAAAFERASRLLNFHVSCCTSGCSDTYGFLCKAGERIVDRMLAILAAFDDDELDAMLDRMEGVGR